MSDIAASERRLSAALDRIDQLLETGVRPTAAAGEDQTAKLNELRFENNRLKQELAALREAGSAQDPAPLADARARLATVEAEAARLVRANDELIAANRDLIAAAAGDASGGGSGDAIREALEAEISALRAARGAEIARLADIMAELDRALGHENLGVHPHDAAEDRAVEPEIAGDAAGVPETDPEAQPDAADQPDHMSWNADSNEGR